MKKAAMGAVIVKMGWQRAENIAVAGGESSLLNRLPCGTDAGSLPRRDEVGSWRREKPGLKSGGKGSLRRRQAWAGSFESKKSRRHRDKPLADRYPTNHLTFGLQMVYKTPGLRKRKRKAVS